MLDVSSFLKTADTDYTNALNAAIAQANLSGETIYFPASTKPYVVSATPTPITNFNVNVRGEGRNSVLTNAPGVTGISLLSFNLGGYDQWQSNGFIEHLCFNGNSGGSGIAGRANVGLSMTNTIGLKCYDLSFVNCLTGILMEDTATAQPNGSNWSERNQFRAITLENFTNGFLLQSDSTSGTQSFEHSLWDGIYFNTYAPGDSVFHLTGRASMGNCKVHVDGNFSVPSGFSSLFLLDGDCDVTGHIVGYPENNGAGAAYAFYAASGGNWVTASGDIGGCALFGGTAWGNGTCIFRGPGPHFLGSFTTTHNNVSSGMYYDEVFNPGINVQCKLFLVPTNAIAAKQCDAFIAQSNVGWGAVNIVHNGVPGGTFDIWCQ